MANWYDEWWDEHPEYRNGGTTMVMRCGVEYVKLEGERNQE